MKLGSVYSEHTYADKKDSPAYQPQYYWVIRGITFTQYKPGIEENPFTSVNFLNYAQILIYQ